MILMISSLATVAAAVYGGPHKMPPSLYVCQQGQCVPSVRGLPLSECEAICVPPLNYTCQGGRCVAASHGIPKALCSQICGGPSPAPLPPPPPPPPPPPAPAPTPTPTPAGKEVEIAPGVMMPSANLGTSDGSIPRIGVPAWFKAGGIGIDIENS